ncbi:MAG: hypothetical protein V1847_05110 [Candidatus Diapherotrites archaeon]
MALHLVLPELSAKHSVKDAVIAELVQEWPLSTQKLFLRVQRDHGLNVSYQAVHKALKELVELGVVSHQADGYCLDKKWIEHLNSFSAQLTEAYSTAPHLFAKKTSTQLSFESMWHLYQFMLNALSSGAFHHGNPARGCAQVSHMWNWFPLGGSKKEYELIRQIASDTPVYIVSAHDSKMDAWCADYYRALGWKVKLGVPCADSCDVFVHGPSIIQIYFPAELEKELAKAFRDVSDLSLSQLQMYKIYEKLFYRKADIKVVVLQDDALAQRYFDKTRAHF